MRNPSNSGSAKNASPAKAGSTDTKMDVPTIDTPSETKTETKPETNSETNPAEPSYSQAQVDQMIERAFSRWAQHNPASTQRPGQRDAELSVAPRVLDVPVDGRLEDLERTDLVLENANESMFEGDSAKLRELAFQEEPVDVVIAESTNPNDQPLVTIWVNGKPEHFLRGEVKRVKRHYATKLGHTRTETVTATAGRNESGEVVNRTKRSNALEFPFTVVWDSNPVQGRQWLSNLMKAH